ncbi:AP-5 complex subunit beta-1 [Echinops telfairi]|uniref:AP-5 complex subunit beta-1 n=9 Tax=Echinops telfairi TaxID=9371 RepID=A0AC55DNB0_ECHTE|nr:AP-5 complex subunit beta-1 [Echinops telfairi]XP_045153228.1 AP-5 complex subunit beta-1 [Echinops telfairi]XP_045153229.1 AP-5 complex subunit beta-1 [Echinops telfairi]XP_045153230.1 AP-5 complex subunit beta-1 [Echinops telfairi]XP_045153231.1 AP-5 complex subunit beta-1 [Echinops telfairi]XP_045153232.1 AP-5 complex subunit beta-1 [Echinops telfairi]XP_045153233.1 AP-5 complex subunit beta-1 [Echinops telfairi]XP_045153234.1 AP-5 complex subunit beta-1 [Echinops telfairi]XP_04515323
MGPLSREAWAQRLGAFRAGPSAFMAGPEGESLGRDLLSDLRSEKLSEQTKVSLLALSMEFPDQLWPDAAEAEAAATSLLDTLRLLAPRPSVLRRPLLLAATAALVAGGALGPTSGASGRLLPLLLDLAAGRDGDGVFGPAAEQRPLQATAWECLRELESCQPGLLGGCLGFLRGLLGLEGPVQPLSLLLALALRNGLVIRARAGAGLGGLLTDSHFPTGGGPRPWDWTLAEEGDGRLQPQAPSCPAAEEGGRGLAALETSPEEVRELRATVAQLLDVCYLLTPVAQAQLLWLLGWGLQGLRGQPPALFKPQLVRLLGTGQLALLHAILALKAAFGEALFTAQDEALLLHRLTAAAQHPALPAPTHLFYLHCLLNFPENWPLGPSGEEGPPLLLGVQLCQGLLPSLLQEPMTLLAHLHLLCLLCAEDGEEESKGRVQSLRCYLEKVLAGLRQRASLAAGPRASATLCFRASYLVASCLAGQPTVLTSLTQGLAQLYQCRPALAPHFVDLLNSVGPELREPLRVALRQEVVLGTGSDGALRWHLQMLAKVAGRDGQSTTLRFLQEAAAHCSDWALQQALLQVCRSLLRDGVAGGLADLLQMLASQLEDPDGQDRARLYYLLLAHLSETKLAMALGPSLAAPALASSLVAENQGFAAALTVQEAPAALRLSVGPRRLEGPSPVLQLLLEPLQPLYSLELRFRVEGQLYRPLEAVHVPCLHPGRPARPLLLPLQPRRPAPTRLCVSAVYTTPTGRTCHAHLPPLPVKFEDLFLPFPSPLEGTGSSFFEELWASCLPKGTESRVWCPLGPEGLEALVSRRLGPFVVVAQPPDSYCVAIHLPPASRLLLRLGAAQEDGVSVALLTDDWTVLPLVGDYLRGLSEAA